MPIGMGIFPFDMPDCYGGNFSIIKGTLQIHYKKIRPMFYVYDNVLAHIHK